MSSLAPSHNYRARVRRRLYTYRNRPAYTWAVFVTTSSGKTVYSDDGFPTMRAAVNAGLFDIAARDHVWRVCAGIGDWR